MGIPKITHQIWIQGWDNLPKIFSKNVNLLHSMNPDYQHLKWDETSLRIECSKIDPKITAKFDSFEHLLQKVDLGRYVVCYNYGGATIDLDMVSYKSLSLTPGLDTANLIVSYSPFPGCQTGWVNNAFIMASEKNPVLLDLIQSICNTNLKESDFLTREFYFDAQNGPSHFNRVIYSKRDDVLILDNTYFEPCFSFDPVCIPSSYTIMEHRHEMSWCSSSFKIFLQIGIIFAYFVNFIGLIILMFIIYYSFYFISTLKILT